MRICIVVLFKPLKEVSSYIKAYLFICLVKSICCFVLVFLPALSWKQKISISGDHPGKRNVRIKCTYCVHCGSTQKCLHQSRQLLCLNSGSSSYEGRIWRTITSQHCTKAVAIQRLLQMRPSFSSFWRMHRYYPPWPHISQVSSGKEERKRENFTFTGLGGRNRDVKVKHLVTQPGNAPKARLSH